MRERKGERGKELHLALQMEKPFLSHTQFEVFDIVLGKFSI